MLLNKEVKSNLRDLGIIIPKMVIPFSMLFTSDFSILRCGIKACVTQMLLKQSQCIPRIIELHCMDAKSISEPMRADTPYSPSFWIYQIWNSRPLGTASNYLPSSVSVDTKDRPGVFGVHGLVPTNIFLQ